MKLPTNNKYAITGASSNLGGYFFYINDSTTLRTSSLFRVQTCNSATTAQDTQFATFAVFR